jgi:hypothetical protein
MMVRNVSAPMLQLVRALAGRCLAPCIGGTINSGRATFLPRRNSALDLAFEDVLKRLNYRAIAEYFL